MKTLMVISALLMAVNVFAKHNEEDSYQEAKKLFKSMSATEALMSGEFEEQFWNKLVPGTSTWYGPTNLCINGERIETINPVTFCTQWSLKYETKTGKKAVMNFEYKGQASRFAEKSKDIGKEYCSLKEKKIASGPMKYQVRGCVLWSKKNKDGDKKYYTKEVDGSRCAEYGMINKGVSPYFQVRFYADRDREDFLGTHRYRVPNCNGDLTPVPAN